VLTLFFPYRTARAEPNAAYCGTKSFAPVLRRDVVRIGGMPHPSFFAESAETLFPD